MLRGLKVALIVYGAISILVGLAFIVVPNQVAASMIGLEEMPESMLYFMMMGGVMDMAVGVWLIVVGRDPLRHITWVKFAILLSILSVVAGSYSVVQGAVDFSQVGTGIVLHAVFAAAFLAFYPWRAACGE